MVTGKLNHLPKEWANANSTPPPHFYKIKNSNITRISKDHGHNKHPIAHETLRTVRGN